jgi:hypothetical protein
MTWALCTAVWFVLSIPIGCFVVRRLVPTVSRVAGTPTMFLSPINNSSARRAPIPSETPARVFSNSRMLAGDKP